MDLIRRLNHPCRPRLDRMYSLRANARLLRSSFSFLLLIELVFLIISDCFFVPAPCAFLPAISCLPHSLARTLHTCIPHLLNRHFAWWSAPRASPDYFTLSCYYCSLRGRFLRHRCHCLSFRDSLNEHLAWLRWTIVVTLRTISFLHSLYKTILEMATQESSSSCYW